jgi:RIO-like serine/threonine protein kinase
MAEKGYEWGNSRTRVGREIKQIRTLRARRVAKTDNAVDACFFAVEIIGVGGTSKVFNALDEKGNPCVIKMYVKRDNDEGKGFLLDNQAYLKAKTQTEKEVDNFGKLYGKLHTSLLNGKEINGHCCVVMPFFKPLTKKDHRDKEIKNL